MKQREFNELLKKLNPVFQRQDILKNLEYEVCKNSIRYVLKLKKYTSDYGMIEVRVYLVLNNSVRLIMSERQDLYSIFGENRFPFKFKQRRNNNRWKFIIQSINMYHVVNEKYKKTYLGSENNV